MKSAQKTNQFCAKMNIDLKNLKDFRYNSKEYKQFIKVLRSLVNYENKEMHNLLIDPILRDKTKMMKYFNILAKDIVEEGYDFDLHMLHIYICYTRSMEAHECYLETFGDALYWIKRKNLSNTIMTRSKINDGKKIDFEISN